MAENSSDNLNYVIEIDMANIEYLGNIRHWDNLKFASESGAAWIKNITEIQFHSADILSIPNIKRFICSDNLLFPFQSVLPIKKMPNLLWVPIDKALPLKLPKVNNNYFGINQSLDIRLVPSNDFQEAKALFVPISDASYYICNASSVRLNPLRWLLVDKKFALIYGEPLLPIKGKAFWQKGPFLFPLGFKLEYTILESQIENYINISKSHVIWWKSESEYVLLDSVNFKPLSIASWRQTLKVAVDESI